MAKLILQIVGGLFIGFTFFQAKNTQQGTQNKLFAIFMGLIVSVPVANQLQVPFLNMRSIYEVCLLKQSLAPCLYSDRFVRGLRRCTTGLRLSPRNTWLRSHGIFWDRLYSSSAGIGPSDSLPVAPDTHSSCYVSLTHGITLVLPWRLPLLLQMLRLLGYCTLFYSHSC